MHAILAMVLTVAAQAQATMKPSSADLANTRAACSAPAGQRPQLAGIKIERVGATAGDLPYLRITDSRTGASMRAYYDATSERTAWSRAACFGIQLRLLDTELGGARGFKAWHSAVFAASGYTAPAGGGTRWLVETDRRGVLTQTGETTAALTLPHEQAHAFQHRSGAHTPRWFGEGHAEWIGRKVTRVTNPELLSKREAWSASQLAAASKPVDLTSWGGVQPTKEAFLRQLTPAEREQVLTNDKWPADMAKRSFTFGPGDLVSDESNTAARYEASWQVYRSLEARHGQSRVLDWANDVTSKKGDVRQTMVVERARVILNADLKGMLK